MAETKWVTDPCLTSSAMAAQPEPPCLAVASTSNGPLCRPRRKPSRRSGGAAVPRLPPGGLRPGGARYPVVYFLHAFMGSALGWFNAAPFTPGILDRLDALFASGVPPVLSVFPDGWTSLGGSQWVDSPGIGALRADTGPGRARPRGSHVRHAAAPASRAVVGRSSGGYGTLVLGGATTRSVRPPRLHSGDCLLRVLLPARLPKAASALPARPAGWSPGTRTSSSRTRETKMRGDDFTVINVLAMAAAYSPKTGRAARLELPFDPTDRRG